MSFGFRFNSSLINLLVILIKYGYIRKLIKQIIILNRKINLP